jgi:hypothetical protein
MPEKIRHRAALLSRSSYVKVTRPAKEGKPKSPPVRPEAITLHGFVELVRASG